MSFDEENKTIDFTSDSQSSRSRFHSTHWSVVVQAGKSDDADRREALEILFGTYWYPLYAFARRKGFPPEQAEDLTQAFFTHGIEKNFCETADPERGKFRTFLLVVFKRFIANHLEYENAQRRGGQFTHLSLDFDASEQRYSREPVDHWTPEKLFDRQWAITLLQTVMQQLEQDYHSSNKADLYREISRFLTGSREVPYAKIAEKLGISDTAIRVAVYRMRDRYRSLLREEIGKTLADPSEIESEIQYLRSAIRGDF